MRVVRGLEDSPGVPTVVTIGNFYAVHKGHRALIRKVRRRAAELEALATVVTFEPHPQKVLRGIGPPGLCTPEGKLALLEEAGADQVVILAFTPQLSRVEPEEFIERILVKELAVKAVIVGSDFRFGRYARGDVTMLRSYGRRMGFFVEGARMAEAGGQTISSTAIRHALAEGDVKWAAKALGRPYRLPGKVVHGAGRGKGLGFPTANLNPPPEVCVPGPGIYAGYTLNAGRRRPSAISVGTNPTFGENPLSVEAFVIDFEGDLYGQDVEFEFTARLRDHIAFPSVEALNEAIAGDVEEARRILA
ncbi:MAG TPA: bifunctional riboflavin kinase/FAD synthetase [Actinomycetota bacterium]|nr:bifunctional riboflavin kinase/FAD synthetase [Actinomycetota bacterium]